MNKQKLFFLHTLLIVVLAAFLGGCPPLSPAGRTMTVKSERQTIQCQMTITGKHFTQNNRVDITITNWPGVDGNISKTVNTDTNGDFVAFESRRFKEASSDETFINILVTGRDSVTGQVVIENTSPEPYLIRR